LATPTDTSPDVLAWEAEYRTRVGIASVAAGALTILGAVIAALGIRGLPDFDARTVTVIDAMANSAAGRANPPGKFALQAIWLGDHATVPLIASAIFGIGTLLIFFPLGYLWRATRARRDRLPVLGLILAAAGAVVFALGHFIADASRYLSAMDFRTAADQSNSAARDALFNSPAFLVGQGVLQLGALMLGFAMVTICLNAMRVGLLTRFMGVLGIIVGIAAGLSLTFPIDQQGIIRSFWLGALGLLILGVWRGGQLPAWTTGEARPWPSQQQLREQRAAAARGEAPSSARPRGTPPPAAPPTPRPQRPEAPAGAQGGSARKRKRKRRS
jgi:hypothetical protein